MSKNPRTEKIAKLNDILRQTLVGGRVMVTGGVQAMNENDQAELLSQVRQFSAFTPDNDPYGERDFGSIDYQGTRYFWKIDYYDRELQHRSADPAKPDVTQRIMTVMRADEY